MHISVIIPVLNEEAGLPGLLASLREYPDCELIVVDGGSDDGTCRVASPFAKLVHSERGRARQMNAGAKAASGDWLLFLHADTHLPNNFPGLIADAQSVRAADWGRFNVRLSGKPRMFRIIECLMNWHSRWTSVATGDQALFLRRDLFFQLGGFAEIPLMEDVEFSKRLRRVSRPCCIETPVLTSSRRWEEGGVLRTILMMWWLRLRFFLGADPEQLVRHYYPASSAEADS